jgi:outer membrane immunogenic protein
MKQFFVRLAFSVAALLPASSVLAADLDIPPPPVEDLRPATYDWTGAYVGGWAGGACIDGTATTQSAVPPLEDLLAGCGGKAGALIGYNYQIDNLVLGVEADYGWGGKIADNPNPTVAISYKLNNIGTVRGRVGYAIDDTLLFATGGFAYANAELSGLAGPPPSVPFAIDKNYMGWTIGGGIEQAVTDNFHLRLDYLYTRMGTENYSPCAACSVDVDWGGEHEVRVAAIWAFGSW